MAVNMGFPVSLKELPFLHNILSTLNTLINTLRKEYAYQTNDDTVLRARLTKMIVDFVETENKYITPPIKYAISHSAGGNKFL